jgi:hypothetical protein
MLFKVYRRMWIYYTKYYAILYKTLEHPPTGGFVSNPLRILRDHWIHKLCDERESIFISVMEKIVSSKNLYVEENALMVTGHEAFGGLSGLDIITVGPMMELMDL